MRHLSVILRAVPAVVVVLLLLAAPVSGAEPEFRVGVAVRDLSDAEGEQEIQVVVVEAGEERVVIVSLDTRAVSRGLRDAVLEHLPEELGVDGENLLLTATGTPDAPDPAPATAGRVAEAIGAACGTLAPAELRFGQASIRGLVRNRENSGGAVDELLTVLQAREPGGRTWALITITAIHAATLRAELRRGGNARLPVLSLRGCMGDQEAVLPEGGDGALGRALAAKVEEALKEPRVLTAEAGGVTAAALGTFLPAYERPLPSSGLSETPAIHFCSIGELDLVCLPGEMCAKPGSWVRRRVGPQIGSSEPSVIVSLANDHVGCFAGETEWREGGDCSRRSHYGPEGADRLSLAGRFGARGGGKLEKREGVRLLTLWGHPRDRGRTHGRLLRTEVREVLRALEAEVGGAALVRHLALSHRTRHRFIPEDLIEEMKGVAEGAEVPYEAVFLLNVFLGPERVEAMAEKLSPYEVVVLVEPRRGRRFLSAGFAGLVGTLAAVNSAGISVRAETVEDMSGVGVDGPPAPLLLRDAVQRCGTLEEATRMIRQGAGGGWLRVTVASEREGGSLSLEASPEGFRTTPGPMPAPAGSLASFDLEQEATGFEPAYTPFTPVSIEPLAPLSKRTGFRVQRLWFSSPRPSGHPENDRFPVEHYVPEDTAHGAIVVLPIWRGGVLLAERVVAAHLAKQGYQVAIVPLPYQFQRAPRGVKSGAWTVSSDLVRTRQAMWQALEDVRSVTDWLHARPEVTGGRVGVLGISLGAHVAAVAYQRDPRFRAGVFVMAGGDPASMVWAASKETRGLKRELVERGVTLAELRKFLGPLDPAAVFEEQPFPGFPRYRGVLMVNGTEDTVIPPENARLLHRALGEPEIVWFPVNHYSMATRIGEVLAITDRHLYSLFR